MFLNDATICSITLELSIMLQESLLVPLENIYRTGITHVEIFIVQTAGVKIAKLYSLATDIVAK